MAITEEPILSRVDRLDNLLRNLEEIRVGSVNNNNNNRSSPKSSCASTVSSSNYGGGDPDHTTFCSSPTSRSLGKSCRPIEDVIIETQHKGTLIDRLSFMEDRVLKVWSQLEGEIESEKKRQVEEEDKQQQQQQAEEAAAAANSHHHHHQRNSPKKAIKRFVKSCVKSKGNSKKMILTC